MADKPQQVQLPVSWVGAEELPVQFVNAFVGVVGPGEIFLNLGSYLPPAIVGATPEEREAQVRAVGYIPIKPIARLALTPARLDEMIKTLQDTRTNYKKLMNVLENQEQDD
jgi:hypothetical protein